MNPTSPSQRDTDREGHEEAVLPAGTRFEGLLVLPHGARIDGQLTGEVVAKGALRIGPNGVVQADLAARELCIEGRVRGDLRATERIVLGPTAEVEGDLESPRLAISEGALLNGRCRAGDPDPP